MIDVVFPLGYREGTTIAIPIRSVAPVVVGPGRKTRLTDEQHAYFLKNRDADFFNHADQEPTPAEVAAAEPAPAAIAPPSANPASAEYNRWANEDEARKRALHRDQTTAMNLRAKDSSA